MRQSSIKCPSSILFKLIFDLRTNSLHIGLTSIVLSHLEDSLGIGKTMLSSMKAISINTTLIR